MQVQPLSNSVSSAVPVAGAAAVLLGKQGESAQSTVLAPVEGVSYSASVQNGPRPVADTYENPSRNRSSSASSPAAETAESSAPRQQRQQQQEEAELELVRELKQRDQEVRAHEQAHAAVGGQLAGGATYTYQQGPDGVRYAVGGEVQIDMSKVPNDPQATLDKMQLVQRAALAPAEPSSQDRQVAAQAGQVAAQAMAEIAQERQDRRVAETEAREQAAAATREELEAARKEQKKADEKEQEEQQVSAAEQMAEYNAKMRRINEYLLEITVPAPVTAGQILDDVV
ncbi:hypothetical protein GJQ55_02655 [Venatoribacter cucullus]|uniref:SprA-related family protein n=1 Tax=Venatoribacter cucullus TaxID=2661630 RepID=A0A9X7UV48_9GAMM|nr:putative metalloprotease CJM1_0395 family protein [Venatoribacter cucullus]QQD23450.1 hypothetical protein GJQ55_02655 [Venatoribacter cucullus]